MKKKNKLNLASLAKSLHTKVHKTDMGVGEFVKYRFKHFKGIVYDDRSGGITLKVPGIDFFMNNGTVDEQIKDLEERIAAYKALEPELKEFKRAVAGAKISIPNKPEAHKSNKKR